jgi:hypothetical protein
VERLEKTLLFKAPAPAKAKPDQRFINLGADGKPTTGDHVAVYDAQLDLTWSAAPLNDGADLTHAEALKACAELQLLGHKDWRAPTIQELLSIVDYERYDPAVDPSHFKGPYSWTWSSTLAKAPSGFAWCVHLGLGYSGRNRQDFHYHVRAVRAVRAGQQLGLLG